MAETVCSECREPVDGGAKNCPHCGYDAGKKHSKYARNRLVIGIVCSLTIIGVPVGALFFWMSHRSSKKARRATVGVAA